MTEKTITLSVGPNCWLATFDNDAGIISLFGTDTLPTPFTPLANRSQVIAAIQAKNPEHTVR